MRWWVARSEYERLWREREDTVHDLTARAEAAERLNEKLIDQLLTLKREGFAAPVAAAAPQAVRQPPRILIDAVNDVSPYPDKTREYLTQMVYQHEERWEDESFVRKLAEQIRNGAQ